MKPKQTVRNVLFVFAAAFSILIVYSTCEQYVALGASIDILPPEGEITYPDAGETPIRGSFVIKGTAKDDEGIDSISVRFKNKETGKDAGVAYSALPFQGTAETIDWTINIDNDSQGQEKGHPLVQRYPILDGEYEVFITLTDKQGKKTVLNQTYKIDNTPPVFIVERPSLSAAHDAPNPAGDGYGAVMKIKGAAADTHELQSITLTADGANPITKKNKENSVDLVMSIAGDSDYDNLWNAAGGNDKPLKAVITLRDNARTYAGGIPGDTGNESAFYYVKNEIEGLLDLNTYTAKVISDYFSGKKGKSDGTPHERAVYALRNTDENARNVLWSKRIIPDTTKSVFSLNPEKSPGFKVTGISPFIDPPLPPLMQFSSTTALTVELYPNRDGNALVAGTDYKARGIKVVLCKGATVDKLKNNEYEEEKILFDAAADNADFSGVEQSGGLIKITKLLPADTKPGLYRIIAEGTDVKNNTGFVPYGEGNKPSKGYFIVKLEATGAPYIFFHALKKYQKEDFPISCDVKNLSGGKVDYKLDADPTGSPASSGHSLLTPDSSGTVYTGSVSMSGVSEGSHTVHVRAYNSDALFNTAQVPFVFDKTPPSPAGLTDPVKTQDHTFSTWLYTFKGETFDPKALLVDEISDIDKVTYRIGTKANSSAPVVYKQNESLAILIAPASSSDPYKWEVPVSFGQKTDNYLCVSIYDKAGNKTDTEFGPYAVNTDSPQVKFEDVRFSLGEAYSEASPLTLVKQNAVIGNGVSENNKKASFKIFAKSDFGIESVKASVGGAEIDGTPLVLPSGKPQLTSEGYEEWTVNGVTLDEGNPNFKLNVKAKSGTVTEWQTPLIVDFTPPQVTQTSPNLENIFFTHITLSGSITDTVPVGKTGIASGPDDTTVKYKIGNSAFVTVHNPGGVEWSKLTYSGGAWTVNISDIAKYTAAYGATVPSGGGVHSIPVKIRVSDKAGNERTSDPFTIKFDPAGGAPFADLTAPKQGDLLGGSILISGSAHVANPASGKTVKEIYLQLGETEAGLESNTEWQLGGRNYGYKEGVKIYPASGSADVYYWNYTLPDDVRTAILGSDSSKEVFLRVRAKNVDGLFGEWTRPVRFTINTDVAEFSDIKLQKGTAAAELYSPNSVWLKGDDFKITGAVSHSAGIQNTIKAESPAVLSPGYEKLDTSDTSGWFMQGNIGSDSGYNFTISIKTSDYDKKAGNIQFDISAIDARTDGAVPVSYPIMLKYDNSTPAVATGVHTVKSNTALFTGGHFAANLDSAKKDSYRVLAHNTVYEVHSITGTNVVLKNAPSLSGTFDYGIVELPEMIYNDGSAYQITGIASDTGSGVQKVTAKLEVVKDGQTKTVSVDMIRSADPGVGNKISIEPGDMVSFKGSLNTAGVPNGKGKLTITAYDGNGNEKSETITDIIVKNNPLKIKKMIFKTDLSGDGDYEDPNEKLEILAPGSLNTDRDFRGTVNKASEFTFKNPKKSALEVILTGGYGTNAKVTLLNGSISGDVVKSVAAVIPASADAEYTAELTLDNALGIGDALEKVLVLKVEDESIGTVPALPPAAVSASPYWYAIADITVGLDVQDDLVPKGFIMPFFYNSDKTDLIGEDEQKLSSVKYEAGKPVGHIELGAIKKPDGTNYWDNDNNADNGNGNDYPSVSGTVILRGIAYDNILLKKLELSGAGISGVRAEFGAGNWTGTSGLNIKTNNLSNNGHYVEWEYEWQTGTPALNQTVMLTVTDEADLTSAAAETEPAEKTGTRNGDRGITFDAGHTAKKHQFIRLYTGEKSYLVQVDTVSADGKTVTWQNTNIPMGITAYKLYDKTSNKTKLSVNVVPYITEIETSKRQQSGLTKNTIRSSDGKYSIIQGSTADFITVKGFNLSSPVVRLVSKTDLTNATETAGISLPTSNSSDTAFSLSNNLSKSGYIEVFAGTSKVRAINNINDNTKPYNKEPDLYVLKNKNLNDDRYLRVFDMKETRISNGYYPEMIMDGDDPVFGLINPLGYNASYGKTLNFAEGPPPTLYKPQKIKFKSDSGAIATEGGTAQIEYIAGALNWEQFVMAKDDGNKYHYISVYDYEGAGMMYAYHSYAETDTSPGGGKIGGWGPGRSYTNYNGKFAGQPDINALALDSISYKSDFPIFERYRYPKIIARGNSDTADGASVYIAYYDAGESPTMTSGIQFRSFKVGNNLTGGIRNMNGTIKSNFSGYKVLVTKYGSVNPWYNWEKYSDASISTVNGRQIVANGGSRFFDMGVTKDTDIQKDKRVVIVYYDEGQGKLKLKYSSAAVDGSNPVSGGSSPAIAWIESGVTFPDYVGQYVSMDIDSSNGIHIAAFDSNNGDLIYFYLENYDSGTLQTALVDAAFSVGHWTQVKVCNNKPYIAYYSNSEAGQRSAIKLAVANDTAGTVKNGVDGYGFVTGDWECMTVPTVKPAQGGTPKFKKVNLGFDTAGRPVLGYLGSNIEFGKWLDE